MTLKWLLALALALVAAALPPVLPRRADGGSCPQGCQSCGRTISVNGQEACEIQLFWLDINGGDGCCGPPPGNCVAMDCIWAGVLEVENTGSSNRNITISGPGAQQTCLDVKPNESCVKTWGGGGNAPISRACADDADVSICSWKPDPYFNCCLTAWFVCAGCLD
jgi:hypothetical protein